MTHIHRHAETLRAIAKTVTNNGNRRAKFGRRLEALLAIYAEHGRFARTCIDKDTLAWLGELRTAYYNGDVSRETGLLWELLDLKGLFRCFAPNRIAARPRFSEELLSIQSEAALHRHVRTRLSALRPRGYVPCEGEERSVTVWWLFLWEWRDYVTSKLPMQKMPDALEEFIAVTRKMRDGGLLTERQVWLVDLLATPYVPAILGVEPERRALRLVAS